MQRDINLEMRGVLHACNGVMRTLVGQPARVARFDLDLPDADAGTAASASAAVQPATPHPYAAVFIECRGSLFVTLFSAGGRRAEDGDLLSFSRHLLDCIISTLGPGCIDDQDDGWQIDTPDAALRADVDMRLEVVRCICDTAAADGLRVLVARGAPLGDDEPPAPPAPPVAAEAEAAEITAAASASAGSAGVIEDGGRKVQLQQSAAWPPDASLRLPLLMPHEVTTAANVPSSQATQPGEVRMRPPSPGRFGKRREMNERSRARRRGSGGGAGSGSSSSRSPTWRKGASPSAGRPPTLRGSELLSLIFAQDEAAVLLTEAAALSPAIAVSFAQPAAVTAAAAALAQLAQQVRAQLAAAAEAQPDLLRPALLLGCAALVLPPVSAQHAHATTTPQYARLLAAAAGSWAHTESLYVACMAATQRYTAQDASGGGGATVAGPGLWVVPLSAWNAPRPPAATAATATGTGTRTRTGTGSTTPSFLAPTDALVLTGKVFLPLASASAHAAAAAAPPLLRRRRASQICDVALVEAVGCVATAPLVGAGAGAGLAGKVPQLAFVVLLETGVMEGEGEAALAAWDDVEDEVASVTSRAVQVLARQQAMATLGAAEQRALQEARDR